MKKILLNQVDDLVPTRQSLLSRLKDWNDNESWKVFFDTYWKLIFSAAIKAGLTPSEAEDVVQDTVIAVSKNIPKFVYDPTRGSFKAWLMKQTGWRISRQFRKRLPVECSRSEDDYSTRTATIDRLADQAVPVLETHWDAEWEENLIEAAIQRVKSKVDAKHYQVFDLCVHKKLPISRISKDLNINRAAIYLIKHRVGNLVKKEIAHLQTKLI